MRQNIRKVIEAFKRGIPAKGDSKQTCRTDGEVVYSYALPIARRVPGRYGAIPTIEIIDDHPTQTTRSQIDALRRTFPDAITVDKIEVSASTSKKCPRCGGKLHRCKTGDAGCLHCDDCPYMKEPR